MPSEESNATLVNQFIAFENNLLKLISLPVVPDPTAVTATASTPTSVTASATVTSDPEASKLIKELQAYLAVQNS